MKRGQRPSAEQVVLMLRQIEVQTAQGKSITVACKEADVSEQSFVTSAYARRSSTRGEKHRS
ncbi:hypothetical protein BV511_10475 [Methylorubrum extorquens]|uniref:hypothetical protein n=2 Tax=Hyphomicrobiales TaxID=356 RepID=UPI000972E9DB|nr:hypothetical protein [Methylorubrum extorquens]APX85094.1 hypothetical protein BV511_10475 [Methylorubrum extorquens]